MSLRHPVRSWALKRLKKFSSHTSNPYVFFDNMYGSEVWLEIFLTFNQKNFSFQTEACLGFF